MSVEQAFDDQRVLDDTLVAVVVSCVVTEREEVVPEAACDHVQVDPPPVQVSERGHHLGNGVRMHVDGLHGNERTQVLRPLKDELRNEPRVDQAVVCVDEDASIPCTVAPARNFGDPLEIALRILVPRLHAGGEDLDLPRVPGRARAHVRSPPRRF